MARLIDTDRPPALRIGDEVREALAAGTPVVALESTLFAHGLPRPRNLEVMAELEALLCAAGCVPATVGVIGGTAVVGLSSGEIELLGTHDVKKASTADLPLAAAKSVDAATTVAATSWLAFRAGVALFATGGLGGVHRGASETYDESADLPALARTPVTVVCAGVKSILDIGATLERLETFGVSVAGYRTDRFPGFFVRDSGHPVAWRVETPGEVASAMKAREALGISSALVIANPVPPDAELDRAWHDRLLADALTAAAAEGVRGQAVTPFLLDHLQRASGGASLEANIAAVRSNVSVAAAIARDAAKR
jgi:pseudouridine-5'-phosphate glycosidase